mgnify:CR=1 FL=1
MELRINGELIPEELHKNYYIFKEINIYSYIAGSGQGRSSLESIVLLHDFYCLIMKWNNETMENNGGSSFAFFSEDSLNPDEEKEIYDKYKEELDLLFSLKDTLTEWHFSENSSFKINIEGNYEKIEKLISWYDNLLEESQIKEIRNMIQIECCDNLHRINLL